jgi:hypothetical protein
MDAEKLEKRRKRMERMILEKAQKKEKRIERDRKIQEARVAKAQAKPKDPFYFFKQEEIIKIKLEFPEFDKKAIDKEVQKRWKVIKSANKSK